MFRAFLRAKVRFKTFSKLFFSIIGQDHTLWSWGKLDTDVTAEIGAAAGKVTAAAE